MENSEGSPEKELYSDIGIAKKDRNTSNKQPNPMPTRTQGTTTQTAQSKQKERNTRDQIRVK